jgi:heterodisulfide reductase subunit A-like polyferredoxin
VVRLDTSTATHHEGLFDDVLQLAHEHGFIRCPDPLLAPSRTTAEGIFVAGAAAGPKDIPDFIVEAGAAAMEATIYLRRNGGSMGVVNADGDRTTEKAAPPVRTVRCPRRVHRTTNTRRNHQGWAFTSALAAETSWTS